MYEVRFYSVAHGRLAAEIARVHDVAIAGAPAEPGGPPACAESLWDRYRIPRPLGAWTVAAGQGAPGFLSIIRWDSLTHRDSAYPRFWNDPYWLALRAKGADGSPLVDSIEDWILRPSAAWGPLVEPPSATPIGGVHEMRVQHVPAGTQAEAAAALATVDLPLARRLGARVLGVFEMVFGPNSPCFVTFLAWPDFDTQQRAAARLDVEPRVIQQRDREMARHHRRVFGRMDQYILAPVPGWGLPTASFGGLE
ncbi:NIPSNAP family protein [Ruixingdingia sedimenti]|uniref:NIPSNAP family protein n=1 Tax=Ruixingdingia sedimenti TaxID=3073604 RepID=A0ABU1F917_9RHOB|nr:NIPSNAP family protein [Xinfangfangia sp. LG-4]MDR5653367.1 NIPSNAP family protein [Xinfangfangia sp. LG-4]